MGRVGDAGIMMAFGGAEANQCLGLKAAYSITCVHPACHRHSHSVVL